MHTTTPAPSPSLLFSLPSLPQQTTNGPQRRLSPVDHLWTTTPIKRAQTTKPSLGSFVFLSFHISRTNQCTVFVFLDFISFRQKPVADRGPHFLHHRYHSRQRWQHLLASLIGPEWRQPRHSDYCKLLFFSLLLTNIPGHWKFIF